jgi:hypothetical protein
MIEWTADARARFDEYVSAVRQSAAGSKDIEEDVRDHVDAALSSAPAPVRLEDLERVLARLGAPSSWVREEELPWWRRVAYRFVHGPEDWRLAYLAFGLTVAGLVLFPFGGFLLLFAAFLVSRAYAELARSGETRLDARRWLVYPAILLVLLLTGMIVLLAPIFPLAAWGIDDGGFHRIANLRPEDQPRAEVARITFGFMAVAIGMWWLIVSLLATMWAPRIAWLFYPITASFKRRHALLFAVVALGLLTAGGLLLFVF